MEGLAVAILYLMVCAYFFPSAIAFMREHHDALAIFLLNLFLGWTLIGWIGALVWAATVVQRREENRLEPQQPPQRIRMANVSDFRASA